MENFGDWFYILILIVAGIGSAISSFNKKTKEASGEQAPPREIIVGDGFDEPQHAPRQDRTRPKPRPTPQPLSRPRVTSTTSPSAPSHKSKTFSDYIQQQQAEGTSTIEQHQYDGIMPNNTEEPALITLEDLPTNTNEWRKAFVYNEIFNRKY